MILFCAADVFRPTLAQKCNPVWWFGNVHDPYPPDWYAPERTPPWWRWLSWYLRNPLQNFGFYVVGCADRDRNVTGPPPVMATTYFEIGQPARWKWSVTRTVRWGVLLPFVSFENSYVTFYLGWQASGFCGCKINIKFTTMQFW